MLGFTSIQIERVNSARKIYSNVRLPTLDHFKPMVFANMIQNCQISVADIISAEKVYGPSMEILKGNSTRSKLRPEIKDDIQITSEI